MPPLVIAQLLVQYGIPLTQQILAMHSSNQQVVTPEDFAALIVLAQYRSADSLAAAGLKVVDGRVVPL